MATKQPAETATVDAPETASTAGAEAKKAPPKTVTHPATKARMVEAKLKTRHCIGGVCKEKGDTMRMTQGEYDRLKKYGRVEALKEPAGGE